MFNRLLNRDNYLQYNFQLIFQGHLEFHCPASTHGTNGKCNKEWSYPEVRTCALLSLEERQVFEEKLVLLSAGKYCEYKQVNPSQHLTLNMYHYWNWGSWNVVRCERWCDMHGKAANIFQKFSGGKINNKVDFFQSFPETHFYGKGGQYIIFPYFPTISVPSFT